MVLWFDSIFIVLNELSSIFVYDERNLSPYSLGIYDLIHMEKI